MRIYILSTLIFIIIFSGLVQAQITFFGDDVSIKDDYTIDFITVTIEPETREIKISTLSDIINFSYSSNFPATCVVSAQEFSRNIICDTSKASENNRTIKMTFVSKDIEKQDRLFLFKHSLSASEKINTFFFRVFLPEGAALTGNESYMPSYGGTASDGRRIFVYWQKDNIAAGELFSSQIVFESFIRTENNIMIVVIIAIVIVIVLIVFGLRKKISIKMVLPILRPDEKIVMQLIMKHGDGVNQKVIVKESNFSKAKVSKILSALAERGVVRLERVGRSNRIYVVKEFRQKK